MQLDIRHWSILLKIAATVQLQKAYCITALISESRNLTSTTRSLASTPRHLIHVRLKKTGCEKLLRVACAPTWHVQNLSGQVFSFVSTETGNIRKHALHKLCEMVASAKWQIMFSNNNNNNTQNAAVAPRPSTTHPLVWAEQHKHTSVYNLPVPGLPPSDTSLHYSAH